MRRIVDCSLSLSPPSPSQGELFLNDQTCRIVQRELLFDLGVAYGIDCLLIDPTLGGRCDTFATYNFSVSPQNSTVIGDSWGTALTTQHGLCHKTTQGWSSGSPGPTRSEGQMMVPFTLRTHKQLLSPTQAWHVPIYPPAHPSGHPLALKGRVAGTNWVPVILQQSVPFQTLLSIQYHSPIHSANIFCYSAGWNHIKCHIWQGMITKMVTS